MMHRVVQHFAKDKQDFIANLKNCRFFSLLVKFELREKETALGKPVVIPNLASIPQ